MCIEDFSVILNRILIFVEPGYGIEDILVNLNSMLKDISMNLNRILRISWSASLILVLYLSCIAIVAPVQPSGRDLILWRIYKNKDMLFHNFQSINMSQRVYLEVHVHDASVESSLSVKGNLGVDFRCILVCTHIGW